MSIRKRNWNCDNYTHKYDNSSIHTWSPEYTSEHAERPPFCWGVNVPWWSIWMWSLLGI